MATETAKNSLELRSMAQAVFCKENRPIKASTFPRSKEKAQRAPGKWKERTTTPTFEGDCKINKDKICAPSVTFPLACFTTNLTKSLHWVDWQTARPSNSVIHDGTCRKLMVRKGWCEQVWLRSGETYSQLPKSAIELQCCVRQSFLRLIDVVNLHEPD